MSQGATRFTYEKSLINNWHRTQLTGQLSTPANSHCHHHDYPSQSIPCVMAKRFLAWSNSSHTEPRLTGQLLTLSGSQCHHCDFSQPTQHIYLPKTYTLTHSKSIDLRFTLSVSSKSDSWLYLTLYTHTLCISKVRFLASLIHPKPLSS